ncbi:MAG: hypothetical protein KDI19_05575 [Pseudomonadales bacterium]|nr:hypothetical protein [Pseudomonadales bacterium]
MRKLLIAFCVAGLMASGPAGATDIVDLAAKQKTTLQARVAQGVVRSIDLDRRTCVIGGYTYEFGPPGLPIKITMVGNKPGAIELLQAGMKVEVTYGDLGEARIVAMIKQLPDDEEVEY